MTRPLHFELALSDCLSQPLCENQRGRDAIADIGRDVDMTPDERCVTCAACLAALGYELPAAEADVRHTLNRDLRFATRKRVA